MKKTPQHNRLCLSCRRPCKQPVATLIASCPRYYPRPKVTTHRFQQLELAL